MANGSQLAVDDGIDFQPLAASPKPAPQARPAQAAGPVRADDGIDFQPAAAVPAPPSDSRSTPSASPQATISAYKPTLLRRIENVFTEGIPRYSSRTVSNPKYGETQILTPEAAMTPGERERHPILTGLGEVTGGLTSPENTAILAASGGLGSLPGAAGRILPRLVSGAFSAQMLWNAYHQIPEFKAAIDRGDISEAERIGTHIAAGGVLGYLAGRHALGGGAAAAEPAETTEAAPENRPARPPVRLLKPAPVETIAGEPVRTRIGPSAEPLITPEPTRTPEGAIRAPVSPLSRMAALPAARGPEPDEASDFLAGKPVQMAPIPTMRPIGVVEDYAPGYRPILRTAETVAPRAAQGEIDFRPLTEETPRPAAQPRPAAAEANLPPAKPAERPPAAPAPAPAPVDKSAEIQRAANLTFGQLRRNPIEQQYARDVWTALTNGERSPQPPEGMPLARARAIQNKMAEIRTGMNLPSVLNPDPRISGQFTPDELEAAHQRLVEASGMLQQATPPGRYEGVTSKPGEERGTGQWYGVTSLRTMFPWFSEMKESPAELARAIERQRGPAYNRLLQKAAEYEQSSRDATRNVVRNAAPDLDELAEQVRGIDPELAQILDDAGAGKLGVFDGSLSAAREWAERHIDEARQLSELSRSIDQAARGSGAAGSGSETPANRAAGGARAEAGGGETPSGQLTEGVLPGLEQAVAEQQRAAGRQQAERLTEEINRPPESIESAAGEMERSSPLFRGTEASPQRELLTPSDQERAKQLQQAIADGEMRLRSGVNAIGEPLSKGELQAVRKSVQNARSELGSLHGSTLYSGVDPARVAGAVKVLSNAWQERIARPLIDRVLKIGDKYQKAREADPAVAEGLELLDNAPRYLRQKAAQQVHDVIGNLSRKQERLFVLLADADSRENLRANHPAEYRQALSDPAIQDALRKYRPIERELTAQREQLGGTTLDQDYLRRVYDRYVAGIGKEQAPGSGERSTSAYDRVIRPQRIGKLSREATAEYHYQNGLHEFGPAFATKFIGTNLRSLRDSVAREFLSKATKLPLGAPEPRSIEYNGETYYRPDVAAEMPKGTKVYDRYDPTAGEKFPQPADGKFLGPREVVRALNDYGRRDDSGPDSLRRFFQEQIVGAGFGVPHIANIMRRVTQEFPGGALNPKGWAAAWRIAFDKELRARGIAGVNDPTFDMLAQHGAIPPGEMQELKRYWGGNLNPANWARAMAQIGHRILFEPGAAKGFGGIDQRARLYVADLVRSERPELSDAEVSRAVRDALGDYSRTNWTERQKMLGKFMMFPGWDFSSIRWVLQHPIRTTVPGAVLVLLANQALHKAGLNRPEDATDIQNIHVGNRTIGVTALRESAARNLFRPFINYAQAKIDGENEQRAQAAAARGLTAGAAGLLGMLRPDLSGFIALATNRQNLFSGKELTTPADYTTPGKILPTVALEKQAALVVRHAIPSLDRILNAGEGLDAKGFIGGNLGLPNYREDAERRLFRNYAESQETFQTVSRMAKTNPAEARAYVQDPDNAAYALFHRDFAQIVAALNRIDRAREAVSSSGLPAAEKAKRLKSLDASRQILLGHADALNNLLFERRQQAQQPKQPARRILTTPRRYLRPLQRAANQ